MRAQERGPALGPECLCGGVPGSSGGNSSRFTVTMLCESGEPMLTLVDDEELAQRKDRRAPRPS